jgi:hypothetical protein
MTLRRITPILALGALALVAGCDDDNDDGGPNQQTARVRVVNVAEGVPAAGLFAAGQALGGSVNFGAANATCVEVPVGESLSFRAASSSNDLVTIATPGLTADGQHTIVLFGSTGDIQAAVLSDNGLTSPAAGSNSLRFFNATGADADVFVSATDVDLTGLTPSVSALAAGQATSGTTAFATFPTTDTQVRSFAVGDITTPLITTDLSAGSLSAGRIGTVVLTDATVGGGANASVIAGPCS